MAKIYVIMGKSAAGKDTVYKRLINDKNLQLSPIVLYTTRPIREGEIEGVTYHYIDNQILAQYREAKQIIEARTYETVHGPWTYATISENINLAKHDYLVIGTLDSYESYIRYFGSANVTGIYIDVSDRSRIHRALAREDMEKEPKYVEMCRRFLADEKDYSKSNLNKYPNIKSFPNEDFEICIRAIIEEIKNDK